MRVGGSREQQSKEAVRTSSTPQTSQQCRKNRKPRPSTIMSASSFMLGGSEHRQSLPYFHQSGCGSVSRKCLEWISETTAQVYKNIKIRLRLKILDYRKKGTLKLISSLPWPLPMLLAPLHRTQHPCPELLLRQDRRPHFRTARNQTRKMLTGRLHPTNGQE